MQICDTQPEFLDDLKEESENEGPRKDPVLSTVEDSQAIFETQRFDTFAELPEINEGEEIEEDMEELDDVDPNGVEGDIGGEKETKEERRERKRKKREEKQQRKARREEKKRKKSEVRPERKPRSESSTPSRRDSEDVVPVKGGIDSDNVYMSEEEPSENEGKPAAPTSQRKKKGQITPEEAMERARAVVQKMMDAADADDAALKEGTPAIAKISLLHPVVEEVVKPKWIRWYIQEDILGAVDRWLSPLPDGSLPNITLRSQLLTLLGKLNVSIEQLRSHNIGRKLVAMWRSSSESLENKSRIRSIIFGVCCPDFGRRWQHKATRQEDEDEQPDIRHSNASHDFSSSLVEDLADGAPTGSRRARVPVTASQHYTILPRGSVERGHNNFKDGSQPTRLNRMRSELETKARSGPGSVKRRKP